MSPSNPSAGTARPDAAPSDRQLLDELETYAVAWGSCRTSEDIQDTGVECAQKFNAVLQRFAALRSALAERDAECERLRDERGVTRNALCVLLDHLELGELDVLTADIEWVGQIVASFASAAVAPAAREDNQEPKEAK